MANRVSVNINVNDNSRAALASLRQQMQRTQRSVRSAGGTVRFNVVVDPGTTRQQMRRIQRSLRGLPVTINTRLNPPTPPARTMRQRILRGLGRSLTLPVRLGTRGLVASVRGPLRILGSMVSGILNDGVGQGILQGFKAAGPAGVAILAAAITAGVALIGAALAATLVFAFGAAFVGLAAYIAVESGRVTKQWDATLDRLADKFKGAAEPIIPVIEHAIELMEELGNSFAPHFKRAIAEAAPSVTVFLDSVAEGIKKFGRRAFEPMMKGFDTFLLAFGPEFEDFMEGLGDAFGALGRTAQRHSGELAIALRMVLGLITTLIDIVNFFANVWAQALRFITFNIGLVLQAFSVMARGIVTGVGTMLDAFATVAEFLPGPLGASIRQASDRFKEFGEGVVEDLSRMGQESKDWGLTMDRANKRRKLEVDIQSLQARLKIARDDLTRTSNKKAKAKVQANIDQLTAELKRARDQLNNLNGKTATTYVETVYLSGGRAAGGDGTRGGRLAHGGNVGAAATGGVRRNMTLVGEQGPELVDLPGGSHVRSNPDTRRMMRQAGSGGGETVIRIEAGSDDMSRFLLKILRNAIRVQGGDVQLVLGN